MALKNFGKVLAKSEMDRSDKKESLYLDYHITSLLKRFSDWNERLSGFKFRGKAECLNNNEFKKAIVKAIFLHDLGKISYEFQRKVTNSAVRNSFITHDEKDSILNALKSSQEVKIGRHEIYSCIWSLLFLSGGDLSSKIRTAVLYHHQNNFYCVDIGDGDEIFEGREKAIADYLEHFVRTNRDKLIGLIDEVKNEIPSSMVKEALKELAETFDGAGSDIDEMIKAFRDKENLSLYLNFYDPALSAPEVRELRLEDYEFLLLLGWLRRCDYSGSANVDIEYPSGDLLSVLENQVKSYDWQSELIKKVDKDKHAVLVAPTGSGKTEFAFLWGALDKDRKLIYTLPLRVALNDIYRKRVLGGYLKDLPDKEKLIDLLHSTAFLEYFSQHSCEMVDVEAKESGARVLNSSLIFSTADQVFLSSLFYYGFDKLFAVYPYSSFVIDEIQSYTPEMMAIIFKTLQHIDRLGGRILIMTATMPPYLKPLVKQLIPDEKVHWLADDVKENKGSSIKKIIKKIKNYDLKRHRIKIEEESLVAVELEQKGKEEKKRRGYNYSPDEEIIKYIKKLQEGGTNVLVILNNVAKATSFYEGLIKKMDNKELLFLLHSRILEVEKRNRIERIKKLLDQSVNNESQKKRKGIILVATQIVEASVDVDFDILFTEISPIDSQIQRWGRVYRNRSRDYTEEAPNIFVFVGNEDNDLSTKLSKIIYSSDILERTRSYLKANVRPDQILSFEDEVKLLNGVFSGDVVKNYVSKIQETLEFLNYFRAEKRSQAQNIFRRLAGRYVVFLDAMRWWVENELEKEKKKEEIKNIRGLYNFLKNNINHLNEITWADIGKEVFGDDWDEGNGKYKIKKWLLDFSINVPEFIRLDAQNFKGFYVYDEKIDKCGDLIEKGLDAVKDILKQDVEKKELELASDYII